VPDIASRRRTNEEWLAALTSAGGGHDAALEELRTFLRRLLAKALRRHAVTDDDLSDLVQEALLLILSRFETFRGDSAFTTWAAAVAIRAAFTELRRRSVRSSARRDFEQVERGAALDPGTRGARGADELAARAELLAALEQAIATELTQRQRTAVLAELRGLPTVEIAARMNTNQNALYKLVHDARRKLRAALVARGFGAGSIHALGSAGEADRAGRAGP